MIIIIIIKQGGGKCVLYMFGCHESKWMKIKKEKEKVEMIFLFRYFLMMREGRDFSKMIMWLFKMSNKLFFIIIKWHISIPLTKLTNLFYYIMIRTRIKHSLKELELNEILNLLKAKMKTSSKLRTKSIFRAIV